MKTFRFLLSAALLLCTMAAQADPVKLIIIDGISSGKTKTNMEQQASTLLSRINSATERHSRLVDLSGIKMTTAAKDDVTRLCGNQYMRCPDKEVVESCIKLRNGYQVRNIPLILINPGTKNEYQEAVINYDKNGTIIGFSFTINRDLFTKSIKTKLQNRNKEVYEVDERMQIVNFVEQFRTSYNKKDLNFLQQIFSDDALIITGRVIKTKGNEVIPGREKVEYYKQSKKEYLNRLKQTFANSKYINVKFEDVVIVKHPSIEGIYGVTVLQKWNASRYSDEGYVFMLWDFRNRNHPQIHVRTWQPKYLDDLKTKRIDPNEVFTLDSFIL